MSRFSFSLSLFLFLFLSLCVSLTERLVVSFAAGKVDRGAFAFAQMGLFTAEQDHALAVVVMKGREFHGGTAHRLYPGVAPGTIDSADGIPQLFASQSLLWRLGYVCYPSAAASRRTTSTYMFPPCKFGCAVQAPTVRSGPEPYITQGGQRLFLSRRDLQEHALREIVMEAANKASDLGLDPSPLFSLEHFVDVGTGKRLVCRLPPRRGQCDDLDDLLRWHMRTADVFLLKTTHLDSQKLLDQDEESFLTLFGRFSSDSLVLAPPPHPPRSFSQVLSASLKGEKSVRPSPPALSALFVL